MAVLDGATEVRVAACGDPGTIELQLPFRAPLAAGALLRFLAVHAVAGVEEATDTSYQRTLRLPHGPALAELHQEGGYLAARLQLSDERDLSAAVTRLRQLYDLDADPIAVDAALGALRPLRVLVRRRPGLRAPGAVDGFETAARTIVGQQVSLAGARRVLGRIVAEHGEEVFGRWRLFPSAQTVAGLDPMALPMPRARGRALVGLATAVAAGDIQLDAAANRAETEQALLGLPGIGPWTAGYLRMRVLGDPDVSLDTDLIVRRSMARLGIDAAAAAGCAPWRSYLSHHLWADFLSG